MNQLSTKMTTTFSNSAAFTTEMQKTMEANDVKSVSPSSITADTTAVPKSAGNVGSADGDNISNETDGADAGGGAIAGAIVGVLVLGGIAVGGFLWYRNKQKQEERVIEEQFSKEYPHPQTLAGDERHQSHHCK